MKVRKTIPILMLILSMLIIAGTASALPPITTDLGDAPDSINHMGTIMTTYPWGATANFPTVYDRGASPHGPTHFNNPAIFHLGGNVTHETEADSGFDADGPFNILPDPNIADLDVADDGLIIPSPLPANCVPTTLSYVVTVYPGALGSDAFVNLWFDWDRDGRWGTTPPCGSAFAPEWAVQNQTIPLPATPGTYVFSTPAFMPIFHGINPEDPLWARITISGVPAVAANIDGSGPTFGYQHGETEDYYITHEMPGIHGHKWNDLNGNGAWDTGEPGIPGWTIELDQIGGGTTTTTTDDDGAYWFTELTPGDYIVSEGSVTGWYQTYPGSEVYDVSYAAGDNYEHLDFGNWQGDPQSDCDLTIQKVHDGDVLTYSGTVNYIIEVQNIGSGICDGPVTVNDTLPEGMSVPPGPFTIGPWSCNADGADPQNITCTYPGSVMPAAILPAINLLATLPASSSPGDFGWGNHFATNCAKVDNPNDINLTNNEDCDVADVIPASLDDDCTTHWDVHISPFLSSTSFWMTIFNNNPTAQTYDMNIYGSPGLTGMGSFTTVPAMAVSVPANDFVNVVITISPQPVITVSPVAPYTIVVDNLTSGNSFSCGGQIWNPDVDSWFWASDPFGGEPLGFPFGSGGGGGQKVAAATDVPFVIHNIDTVAHTVNLRIESMGMITGGGANPISLNGLPDGDAVVMTNFVLPASSTTEVPLTVEFSAEGDGDVIMFVDSDQDGDDDAATSLRVYTHAPFAPTAVAGVSASASQNISAAALPIVFAAVALTALSLVTYKRKHANK